MRTRCPSCCFEPLILITITFWTCSSFQLDCPCSVRDLLLVFWQTCFVRGIRAYHFLHHTLRWYEKYSNIPAHSYCCISNSLLIVKRITRIRILNSRSNIGTFDEDGNDFLSNDEFVSYLSHIFAMSFTMCPRLHLVCV